MYTFFVDGLDLLHEYAVPYWTWALVDYNPWIIAVGMSLIISVIAYVILSEAVATGHGVKGNTGMRAQEKILIEDILVDGIEQAVLDDRLSRRRATHVYNTLSGSSGLHGLALYARVWKKISGKKAAYLKNKIKENLKQHTKPSPIPGPKPGEGMTFGKPKVVNTKEVQKTVRNNGTTTLRIVKSK